MIDTKTLKVFVRLARRGGKGGSGGEKAARRIAECLLDDLPCFDDRTVDGLLQFIAAVKLAPESARDLIEAPTIKI